MARKKEAKAAPSSKISDDRFASFETDPRFRLPSKKHAKTTLDKRFSGMLEDNDFTAAARVDRYGRKIKSDSKKKTLQRLYKLEDEEEEDPSSEDNEDEDEQEIEVEDDEVVQRELLAAHEKTKKYDPARDGGFSSSESDSDSDSDEEDDAEDLATGGDMQRLEGEEIETGEVTNRIAIVNLDWDHVKSTDLMALFSSFIPANDGGKITNIAVYPSEFGKERMQQEDLEGPPKELFKKKKKADASDEGESDSEAEEAAIKKELIQEGNDQDFDSDALRAYQLDRLRYYYAVMTCSNPKTAQAIYEATDGTEYQSSSNFIDLRFVPDEVTFDDEPRDQCDKAPESYKPIEFVTNALQSSKVKLTWDMHPEEVNRKESIKRAFKGSRAELEEQDLKAYLAGDTDSDEEEEDEEDAGAAVDSEPKLTKKELARKKMREALGLSDEPTKRAKDGPVGEMEVTFTPALSDTKPKKSEQEETTIEKYARKEKERKERKREAARAKRAALEGEDESDGNDVTVTTAKGDDDEADDLGFDDPFFTTEGIAPASKTSIRKEERRKKREAREVAEAKSAQEKAHLTKVMAEDAADEAGRAEHLDHFDMSEIMRAEKQKSKKKKHQKPAAAAAGKAGGLQEGFEMDVQDERFRAVFDSHEFAIDPSNPKFKATEGMKKLLEEGRKKRRAGDDDGDRGSGGKKARKGKR